MDEFWARKAKRQAVNEAEADGLVADSMEVRKAIMVRVKAGDITLAQGQAELKAIKRGANDRGLMTREQAYSGRAWRGCVKGEVMSNKPTGALVVPDDIASLVRSLPESIRNRLSFHDIDVLTKGYRQRIADLERQLSEALEQVSLTRDAAHDDAQEQIIKAEARADAAVARLRMCAGYMTGCPGNEQKHPEEVLEEIMQWPLETHNDPG